MKRVSVILIAAVALLMISCDLCPAQAVYPKTDTLRTITTAVDTVTLTSQSFIKYELLFGMFSATDTLQWRTENESFWRIILPSASGKRWLHVNNIYAKKIFRKAKSGSGIRCTLEAY